MMIKTVRTLLWVIAAGLLGTGQAFAAGNADEGRIKANTCMGCHGIPAYTNVYPTYHVPKLGGQSEQYIVSALKAYRSGERNHPTMRAQAASMSDQDMEDIAAFLSRQK